MLEPYRKARVESHTGPFVFQFGTINQGILSFPSFLEKLDAFFALLPKDFEYSCELRNPEYLQDEYFNVLNTHGATHCFNHWNYMPSLKKQMIAAANAGGLSAPFYVTRILTPRGMSYQDAVKAFQPYDRVQRENQEMREDVVRLVQRAVSTARSAYIIVNNRAEGNSPMTLSAIGKLLHGTIHK